MGQSRMVELSPLGASGHMNEAGGMAAVLGANVVPPVMPSPTRFAPVS